MQVHPHRIPEQLPEIGIERFQTRLGFGVRHGLQYLGVQPQQVGIVVTRRRAAHLVEVLQLDQRLHRRRRFERIRGADLGQVRADGQRLIALGLHRHHRQRAQALGQRLAIGADQ